MYLSPFPWLFPYYAHKLIEIFFAQSFVSFGKKKMASHQFNRHHHFSWPGIINATAETTSLDERNKNFTRIILEKKGKLYYFSYESQKVWRIFLRPAAALERVVLHRQFIIFYDFCKRYSKTRAFYCFGIFEDLIIKIFGILTILWKWLSRRERQWHYWCLAASTLQHLYEKKPFWFFLEA